MGVIMAYEQMCLFDICSEPEKTMASCWTGIETVARKMESWMKRLVPDGEYVVDIGGHYCVLRPTRMSVADIPEGYLYCHYQDGRKVYAGIFVGEAKEGGRT